MKKQQVDLDSEEFSNIQKMILSLDIANIKLAEVLNKGFYNQKLPIFIFKPLFKNYKSYKDLLGNLNTFFKSINFNYNDFTPFLIIVDNLHYEGIDKSFKYRYEIIGIENNIFKSIEVNLIQDENTLKYLNQYQLYKSNVESIYDFDMKGTKPDFIKLNSL